MNKPFLDKLRKIDPYVPGEQPKTANVIKLNANENPYPPAPGVTEVLRTFDAAKLAVYPDANAKALKTALAEIEDLLQHNADCVVIIDEAYVDFGAESAISLIEKYENLLVVQTSSKSRSLAGMRIGYAFGSETLISTLEAVKNSYNSYTMDSLALAVGEASIRDEAYFRETCRKVAATRDRAADELRALGFEVTPSLANFLFATHPKKAAPEIFSALREKGIFIRYFKLPRIDNHLRITVGTDEQMDALIAALKQIL